MSEEVKQFVVEIDAETYTVLQEFCEQANEEDHEVVKYFLDRSMADFVSSYQNLKQGYVEMASINLEMSNAFSVSENEAFSYIE